MPPKSPLIHCITNAVTAPFVADCIAAVGGRPIMAEDPADCAALAQTADGLCINLGQLTDSKQAAILASLKNRGDRPWTLDPVGVGALPSRLAFAKHILEFQPTLIRGNASEVYALATDQASGSGTDSQALDGKDWAAMAKSLHADEVVVTHLGGDKSYYDAAFTQNGAFRSNGGHPWMGQFPGFGCALSAACTTLGEGAKTLATYNRAGRRASNTRFGDFRQAFLSHLAKETRRDKIRDMLRLYLVAGPQDAVDLEAVLAAALPAGVTCYQRREKGAHVGSQVGLKTAQTLAPALIWNDDIDKAAGHAGVHLGQDDGDPRAAREKLGPDAIIGLSISQPEHWAKYDTRYVDYVGIGPFAATQTKPDGRKPLGAAGIRALRQGYEHVPAVAIGGITAANAAEALGAGVDGIAVVSAITAAQDPGVATRNLSALAQSHFAPKSGDNDLV